MTDIQELTSISVFQVRNNSMLCYRKNIGHRHNLMRSLKFQENIQNLKEHAKYTGAMSIGAQKRLTKAINIMVAASPMQRIYNPVTGNKQNFRLGFLTLTIPEKTDHTLSQLNKLLLEPFLKYLRQVHKIGLYVWKAERQKRGVIHYHITINKFVHYQELRNKWNKLLSARGLNISYITENGHSDANSIDIHSVKKVNDLAAYLVKYMCKTYQNSGEEKGKLWDCSRILKESSYFEVEATEDILFDISNKVSQGRIKVRIGERCSFYKMMNETVSTLFPNEVAVDYNYYISSLQTNTVPITKTMLNCIKKATMLDLKRIQSEQHKKSIKPKPEIIQLFLNLNFN